MYSLKFSCYFRADVREAVSYIKNTLKAFDAARMLAEEIKEKSELLRDFPLSAPLVRDEFLSSQGIRYTLIRNYTLFFRVNREDNVIEVLRLLYGRREWKDLIDTQDSSDS